MGQQGVTVSVAPGFVVVEGATRGTRWEVREGNVVIGRALGLEFRLRAAGVSRRHIEVRREGAHIAVRDLGSKNGSAVDGVALEGGWVTIRHGQRVTLGDAVLELDDPASWIDGVFPHDATRTRTLNSPSATLSPPSLTVPVAFAIVFALVSVMLWYASR